MLGLTGCNGQPLDLDKIDFNKKPSFEDFKLSRLDIHTGTWIFDTDSVLASKGNQKGTWVLDGDSVLTLKGNLKSTHYYFRTIEELDLLRFNKLPIDDIGAKLVEYNNKLVYADFSLNYKKTFEVFNHLKQKLGMPEYQLYKTIVHNKEDPMVKLLLKNLNKDDGLKKTIDEYDDEIWIYPYRNVWVKDNLIYQYTLGQGVDRFNNKITIISKEAIAKKIVFGYHNLVNDPIFKNF